MDKFIMFAGRQIPIAIPYPVFSYVNNTGPSFYKPDATLTEDRLVQMSLLRPDRRNYSWRARLTRTPEQLFNVPQDEVDMLGQLVHQIALHHDVTTDAATTFNVLCTRGLSTHFVVNYDGALYQFMDCYHVAWATGDNNAHSIAIDMNNPVYPEMRDSDPAAGMREIYQGKVNGSVKTMLGYTEAQYDTIKSRCWYARDLSRKGPRFGQDDAGLYRSAVRYDYCTDQSADITGEIGYGRRMDSAAQSRRKLFPADF